MLLRQPATWSAGRRYRCIIKRWSLASACWSVHLEHRGLLSASEDYFQPESSTRSHLAYQLCHWPGRDVDVGEAQQSWHWTSCCGSRMASSRGLSKELRQLVTLRAPVLMKSKVVEALYLILRQDHKGCGYMCSAMTTLATATTGLGRSMASMGSTMRVMVSTLAMMSTTTTMALMTMAVIKTPSTTRTVMVRLMLQLNLPG